MKKIIMLLSAAFLCTVSAMAAEGTTNVSMASGAEVRAPYITVNPVKGEYWVGGVKLPGQYVSHTLVAIDYPGAETEYAVYGERDQFCITSYPDSNGFVVYNVTYRIDDSTTGVEQIYIYPTYQTK